MVFLGQPTNTVGAPAYTWANNTNTGIYLPAASTLGIVTAGADRIRVLSNGNVGIGTTAPQTTLHVNGRITSSQPYYAANRYNYGGSFRSGIVGYTTTPRTNVASWYVTNGGNSYFQPLQAGLYFFTVNEIGAAGASGGGVTGEIHIRLNGSTVVSTHWNDAGGYWDNISATTVIMCNGTTDKVDINVVGSVYANGGAYGSFTTYLIG